MERYLAAREEAFETAFQAATSRAAVEALLPRLYRRRDRPLARARLSCGQQRTVNGGFGRSSDMASRASDSPTDPAGALLFSADAVNAAVDAKAMARFVATPCGRTGG